MVDKRNSNPQPRFAFVVLTLILSVSAVATSPALSGAFVPCENDPSQSCFSPSPDFKLDQYSSNAIMLEYLNQKYSMLDPKAILQGCASKHMYAAYSLACKAMLASNFGIEKIYNHALLLPSNTSLMARLKERKLTLDGFLKNHANAFAAAHTKSGCWYPPHPNTKNDVVLGLPATPKSFACILVPYTANNIKRYSFYMFSNFNGRKFTDFGHQLLLERKTSKIDVLRMLRFKPEIVTEGRTDIDKYNPFQAGYGYIESTFSHPRINLLPLPVQTSEQGYVICIEGCSLFLIDQPLPF